VKPEFSRILPEVLQEAVRDIERLIGSEIEVKPTPEEITHFKTDAEIVNGRCMVSILYPASGPTSWGLVHEALHLRRNWLEHNWRLFAHSYITEGFPSRIDNTETNLEHIVIVPQERQWEAPTSDKHWTATLLGSFDKLPTGRPELHWTLLELWAFIKIALPHIQVLNERGRAVLHEHGLLTKARHFVDALRPCVADKPAAIQMAVKHLGLPHKYLGLLRWDISKTPVLIEARDLAGRALPVPALP
jgi:hypothetical protein